MKSKLIIKIIAVLGIILLGVGIGFGTMFLKEKFFPAGDAAAATQEKKLEETGPLLNLGEFLVNLKGGGMIKTEITVEGVNAKSEEKLKTKEAFLRDKVITVFSAKDLKTIISVEERENLKQELIQELNKVSNDQVKGVLFNSFVYSF